MNLSDELEEICQLHTEISKRLKQYEQARKHACPPELGDEFRYALRAMMQVAPKLLEYHRENTCNVSVANLNSELNKVRHALLCVHNDLLDGLALDLSSYLEFLTKNYLEETIEHIGLKKRHEIITLLRKIESAIVESREKLDQRIEIYQELYQNYFEDIKNHKWYLEDSMGAISELHFKKKRARRKKKNIAIVSIIATVLVGLSGYLIEAISLI